MKLNQGPSFITDWARKTKANTTLVSNHGTHGERQSGIDPGWLMLARWLTSKSQLSCYGYRKQANKLAVKCGGHSKAFGVSFFRLSL